MAQDAIGAGLGAAALVQTCNKVLVYSGLVARVATVEEVLLVCSSTGLFVATVECLLQHRLDDVIRQPTTAAERAHNINTVIDVLSQILSCDLAHIAGERIVEGSLEDVSNLLELLACVCNGKPLLGPPQPNAQRSEAHADAAEPQLPADGPVAAEAAGEQERDSAAAAVARDGEAAYTDDRAGRPEPRPPPLGLLSPIVETSREGHDATAADTDSVGQRRHEATAPEAAPPRSRSRRVSSSRASAGSEVAIPTAVGSRPRGLSRGGSSRGGGSALGGEGSTLFSDGSSTLLEQAVSHAEATLRGYGDEYTDFFAGLKGLEDLENQRRRTSRRTPSASTSTRSAPGVRALRAGPWPDGRKGTAKQHARFLRKAQRVLAGGAGSSGGGATSASAAPSGTSARSDGGGSGATSDALAGARRVRSGAAAAKMVGLGGSSVQPDVTRQGRRLIQRTAAAYSAALPSGRPPVPQPAAGLHMNAELAGQLRYVHGLAQGQAGDKPNERAARVAVHGMRVRDEHERVAQRRELVERLSRARARRERALSLTADRLREQSSEYSKRVEALRLTRLAAEWQAKQQSAEFSRALQAEAVLREAFMGVLQGEKEVLLEQRRAQRESQRRPSLCVRAVRDAERQFQEMLEILEHDVARERQMRVRASREAQQAQRYARTLGETLVHDRVEELLARVHLNEEAVLNRRSITSRGAQGKQELMVGLRRLLGLP